MATTKKALAKKPTSKKKAAKSPAAKKSTAKKSTAKKAAAKKATAKKTAKKAVAKKADKSVAKTKAKKAAKVKEVAKPKKRKAPPKMKKMVVKPVPIVVQEKLFENNEKDFAFAVAESMMNEQRAAASVPQPPAENVINLPKRPTSRVKGMETLKFSDADLAQFRKSLVALRMSIVSKTATLKTNALEQTIDRAGEDEDGSDSFMRLQNPGQVGEQNKTLQKIDEALH